MNNKNYDDKYIEILKQMIAAADNIVFFGGAGVSVPSGIPDFRSSTGLFQKIGSDSPESYLSHSFFISHPEEFMEFYRKNLVFPKAVPNDAHLALAKLEQAGKLKAIITQNIDGLHQKAGSKNVLELHGSVSRNYCMDCHQMYPLDAILGKQKLPRCHCGGIIRPDIVLYEEELNGEILEKAYEHMKTANLLLIAGTSLAVYPAARLVQFYCGKNLVIINKTPTPYDQHADLVIHESVDVVLKKAILE